MGEATYYAKAVWPTAQEVKEAAPKVEAFLRRVAECYERWQKLRSPGRGWSDLPEELAELRKQIKKP